jgi:hypothetical protein
MAWPLVASGAAAALGAAATGVVLLMPIDGGTQAWIDSPTAGAELRAGSIVVTAHATDPDQIEALTLTVDGQRVDEDKALDRSGLLAFGVFGWTAAPGTHVLRVAQVGGAETRSDELVVTVVDPEAAAPRATPTATPTASARPSASSTPSTSPTATPTATPSASVTATVAPSAAPTRTRTPTAAPTRSTPPPAPRPAITSAVFTGPWASDPKLYAWSGCPYTVRIEARIQNATHASVTLSGVGSYPMSSSGSTWAATLVSGFDAGQVGTHTVGVTATGPGGTTSRTVGTVTLAPACPKD